MLNHFSKLLQGDVGLKIRDTGIEFVDQTLGTLYNGLTMMFSADSSTVSDAQKLGSLIVLNILENGGGCVLVYKNLPFSLAVNETLYFHTPQNKLNFEKAINEGRLLYLNIAVEDATDIHFNHSEFIKTIANEPKKIIYEVLNAKRKLKNFQMFLF